MENDLSFAAILTHYMILMLTSFNLFVLLFLPGTCSACEARSPNVVALYRGGNANDEFLTINKAGMVSAIPLYGFDYRGVVGYLWIGSPPTNNVNFYRYVTNNIGHFYTTSLSVVNFSILRI